MRRRSNPGTPANHAPLRSKKTSHAGLRVAWTAATTPILCGLLVVAVGLVFGQTVRHEFINYDDDLYVYENPTIARGLTVDGIRWSFTHSHVGNWHPLTSISHMLDCQLYDLWAGGHHLTNVLLHAATAVVLLLILRSMTGELWPSAMVAALFAIHPLRVESVAWVAERKDVLSGLLFMLTLAAYLGYARRPFSLWRYLLVAVFLTLGLMAKPMLVTAPFVLLLLDYWPLGRLSFSPETATPGPARRRLLRPIVEKIPLLALAAGSCVATIWAQRQALVTYELISPNARVLNAIVSYADYLGQTFYPAGLAILYPHPGSGLPIWKFVTASVVLTFLSVAVVILWRRCPALLVGWFWYLGMLVPVIGLVQVGSQAMADRYTYLPQIGFLMAVVWGIARLVRSWPHRRWVCSAAAVAVLGSLTVCAHRQTSHWQSNKTLWPHVLACTSNNSLAYLNLGSALQREGDLDAAIELFEKALVIRPDYLKVLNNLAAALASRGRIDEGIARYQQALAIDPDYAEAHNNLGVALSQRGRVDEAIAHYRRALDLKPEYADVCNNLGVALAGRGQSDEAIAMWQQAMTLDPRHVHSHQNLGSMLFQKGRVAEALVQLQEAIRLRPTDPVLMNGVAWVLATCPDKSIRNGPRAVELATRAVEISGGRRPEFLKTLAEAYAETGRLGEALDTLHRGLALATAQGKADLANELQRQIQTLESARPK